MEKQLLASIPISAYNAKLKDKDATHAQVVADLQAAEKVSEERRLEAARLSEEVKKLREAEKQRMTEVESLRKNGDELRRQLKEAVDAHDETVKAAKERELDHDQLVRSLVSEAESVNGIILGTCCLLLCLSPVWNPLLGLTGSKCRLLS